MFDIYDFKARQLAAAVKSVQEDYELSCRFAAGEPETFEGVEDDVRLELFAANGELETIVTLVWSWDRSIWTIAAESDASLMF